jgi:hypothetical protein
MDHSFRCHCCPGQGHDHSSHASKQEGGLSRRAFLAGTALGGSVLTGLSWSTLVAASPKSSVPMPPGRKPLRVKPILSHDLPKPVPMRSWRSWGGIHTEQAAAEEVGRIEKELAKIGKEADYPVEFLPVSKVTNIQTMKDHPDVKKADVLIVYGAGHSIDGVQNFGKDVIIFQRWKSGPVYLQYEIVSPRFLRQHTDRLALENITFEDVVTDDVSELDWRLRSLCGLKNTRGTRILAIGGAGAWAHPGDEIPAKVEEKWGFDIVPFAYDELGKLIEQAQSDKETVALAKHRAEQYLDLPETTLETKREYVDNCFLLDQVFRAMMQKADCKAITVLGCMGTIMPKAKTSACLTLSTLNDDGYLAFCESDFVVIPSGVLMANITGRPVFLNDPTYPHDQIITLAHCTGPRKMDGKTLEPTRLVTHFESDFGAAPKVNMPKGQVVTNILPDFELKRWGGLRGEIVDHPFKPICRDQIDVRYQVPDQLVAARMPGFHWMTGYGDSSREIGYALRRVGIEWDDLDGLG